jgi:hypothetical protein
MKKFAVRLRFNALVMQVRGLPGWRSQRYHALSVTQAAMAGRAVYVEFHPAEL